MGPGVTLFEEAQVNAARFVASMHTLAEIQKSIDEYSFALKMIDETSKIEALQPSVADFQKEIDEIDSFHIKCAQAFEDNLNITA